MTTTTEQAELEAYKAWAEVHYRNVRSFTRRDFDMGLAAWKAARAAPQGVPEGWKLVPIEPTEAMYTKGALSIIDGAENRPSMSWADESVLVYRAMVSAAPMPPVVQSEPLCTLCHGHGVIHTGMDESPTTQCNACDGTGLVSAPPVAVNEELLEALEHTTDLAGAWARHYQSLEKMNGWHPEHRKIIDKARAAIARATKG